MSEDKPNAVQLLQYVPHDRVREFLAAGWVVSDNLANTHHGRYSVLMVREPVDEETYADD